MGTIRGLEPADWDDWRALWGGYLAFYRAQLSDETTRATFERLCAGRDGMFGLLALDDAGRGIGMANCVVHASTWSRQPKTYLEDLFVAPSARGHDLGRALLEAVKRAGRRAGRDAHLLAHPAVQRAGPLALRQRRESYLVRRLRDVAVSAPVLSQPFPTLRSMPRPRLRPRPRRTAPARAGR